MTGIAEHAKHLSLEIVWLVIGIPIVDSCELQTNAGFLIKMLSGPSSKHRRQKSLERDALLVDDGLSLVDHFFFRFDEGQIEIGLRDGVRDAEIHFCALLKAIDDLGGHIIAGEA